MTGGALSPFSLSFSQRGFGGIPPDPMLALGPDHAITIEYSTFNRSLYRVYVKAPWLQVKQSFLTQFHRSNTICRTGPFVGSPGATYDRLADRWIIWELARTAATNTYTLCFLLSLSGIPYGLLYRGYAITLPADPGGELILSVGPEGYYLGTLENPPAVYALDRTTLLTGGTPRPLVRFNAVALTGYALQGLMPADLVGVGRTGMTCGLFIRPVDDELHGGVPNAARDYVEVWQLCPNWEGPSNLTFFSVEVSEFDMDLCSRIADGQCFPQPSSVVALTSYHRSSLARATFRNFGTHESLLANFPVDGGNDQGAIMWVELRRTIAGPFLGNWYKYQDGIVRHSGRHAWLGTASMDRSGNIAVGYAGVDAGGGVYPSLYMQGRTTNAPLGLMSSPEMMLVAGTVPAITLFGGRSWMALDPTDGCTYYLLGPWASSTSISPTFIGATSFSACRALASCRADLECNDGQYCTLDKCRDGVCVSEINTLLCPYGTTCNESLDACL